MSQNKWQSCLRKVAYYDEASALEAYVRLSTSPDTPYHEAARLEIYLCPWANFGHFHVGHYSKKEAKRRAENLRSESRGILPVLPRFLPTERRMPVREERDYKTVYRDNPTGPGHFAVAFGRAVRGQVEAKKRVGV